MTQLQKSAQSIFKLTENLSFKSKYCLWVSIIIISLFILIQTLVILKIIIPTYTSSLFGYFCIWMFVPHFYIFTKEFIKESNSKEKVLLDEVLRKNMYLEYAAKILRHDMHSGINTYLPRGIKALERKLSHETIQSLKLESSLKLLKEGLLHTQEVYKGVYEFTDLVREDTKLNLYPCDIKELLSEFLTRTSYSDQVIIEDLVVAYINPSLFCTAIDNLIRNGLKYNDDLTKWVRIKMVNGTTLAIIDNGRGLSKQQFKELSKPYIRMKDQKESGSGLGLNISIAILDEHKFKVDVEKLEKGTMFMIDIHNNIT